MSPPAAPVDPAVTITPATLTGAQKAAVAVLALDEELAVRVLSQLDDTELRRLGRAVDELGPVADDALAAVFEELQREIGRTSVSGPSARRYLRRVAGVALGEARAQQLFMPDAAPEPSATELMRTARVETLGDLLADEHPQIAALILTLLPAKMAAKVLRQVPTALASDLLARLSALDEVPAHALQVAADSVARALASSGGLATSDTRDDFDGLAFSASLVNEMPAVDSDRLLEEVAAHDAEVGKRIREAMFVFEDLLNVDVRQMATVLREASSEVLVVALQGAPTELAAHFFAGLSKRVADTLRDDLASSPPRRVAEVEAAQREILELVSRLAREGKVVLPSRGGDQ